MAIKLHRCSNEWVKISAHPCWKVQKALDEQGIYYELVKGPLRTGKRDELERLSGQRKYPVIEFEDGRVYREESKDMAERIRSKLLDVADLDPALDKLGAGGVYVYRRNPIYLTESLPNFDPPLTRGRHAAPRQLMEETPCPRSS
jgi:hypothetical protein